VKGVESNNPTSSNDRKEVSIGMLRRISVLLLSALVMVALVANVALAAPPDNKGACDNDVNPDCAEEDKKTGPANDPNAWGSVVTQTAIPSEEEGVEAGTFGEHASDPPGDEPRDGLGNRARNDQNDEGTDNCFETSENPDPLRDCDTGDNIGDHACIADTNFDAVCALKPGSTAPGGA
jgi:hypothetical protein